MSLPEELEHFVARVVAAMPKPNMETRVLRWEHAYDLANGLGTARRREVHAAATALCRDGGLLFVVLPLGEFQEGGNFAAVRAAVAAVAGKANLGSVEAEVMVGKVLAFDFAAVPEVAPLSAELDATPCPASDLVTEPFQRASRAFDGDIEDDGITVMTALDRELVSMKAATREGVRIVGTVAGVLAFHRTPYEYLPGARVVIDAATGAGYHGSMSDVVINAAKWATFQGFPHHAVAELVRNAWVHRDWSQDARTTPIVVRRNGRRLDVVTPGVLTRAGHPRNPVLQLLCRRAGLVTGHGIGIEDLRDDLMQDGKCYLEMSSMGGEVRARLTLAGASGAVADQGGKAAATTTHPVAQSASSGPTSTQSAPVWSPPKQASPAVRAVAPVAAMTPPARPMPVAAPRVTPSAPMIAATQVHVGANARDEQLLGFVAARGEVSCKLVQNDLGWSRSTSRDVLARLVSLGRLRRTAEDPRSPSQSYVIA